jgi:gamma-glutamylaminecyclotransferase
MIMIFVFGTLKRGFPLHSPALDGARYLGVSRTVERWPMLVAGKWFAPMMLPQQGRGVRVEGELYAVTRPQLDAIDRIESVGKPGNLRRSIVVGPKNGGLRTKAFVYMNSAALALPAHSALLSEYRDTRFIPPWRRS